MIRCGYRRYIADGLAIRRGRHVLERGSDAKIMILVEEVAEICQTVSAPPPARSAGVATGRVIAVRRRRLRVVQVHSAAPGGRLEALECYRENKSAPKRNHEFVVAPLDRPHICLDRILVVRS